MSSGAAGVSLPLSSSIRKGADAVNTTAIVAVLSDVHSNFHALEACVRHALAQGASHFLFLGDYVSQCPDTRATLDLIYDLRRRYPCQFIRGNREEYMLEYRAAGGVGWYDGSASGCLLQTYEQLLEKDFDFFNSLLPCGVLSLPGLPTVRYCHGSPASTREGLFPDEDISRRALFDISEPLLLCGHTHIQGRLECEGKTIVNPGSVGLPFCLGGGKAQYALLNGEGSAWHIELFQISYDLQATLKAFDESGLSRRAPAWVQLTKHALRTGEDYTTAVLLRTRALCEASGDIASWPRISETYWNQALTEFGLPLSTVS